MIQLILLLCLAWSIRQFHQPLYSLLAYAVCMAIYILLSSSASLGITLGVIGLQIGLGALYVWILHKVLSYIHLDGSYFWWTALFLGVCINAI